MVLALIQTVDCTDIVHGLDLKVFSSCKAIGWKSNLTLIL